MMDKPQEAFFFKVPSVWRGTDLLLLTALALLLGAGAGCRKSTQTPQGSGAADPTPRGGPETKSNSVKPICKELDVQQLVPVFRNGRILAMRTFRLETPVLVRVVAEPAPAGPGGEKRFTVRVIGGGDLGDARCLVGRFDGVHEPLVEKMYVEKDRAEVCLSFGPKGKRCRVNIGFTAGALPREKPGPETRKKLLEAIEKPIKAARLSQDWIIHMNDDGLLQLDADDKDLTPLKRLEDVPLAKARFLGTRFRRPVPAGKGGTDISALGSFPLRNLEFLACWGVNDLRALKGLQLVHLKLYKTGVTDVSPLRGMPLSYLDLFAARVSDISALEGMPLRWLDLGSTQVSDISPLFGMPLTYLDIRTNGQVIDLRPLQGMKLKYLCFDPTNVKQGLEVVREMKSLKKINRKSPQDFWKEYDARQNRVEKAL